MICAVTSNKLVFFNRENLSEKKSLGKVEISRNYIHGKEQAIRFRNDMLEVFSNGGNLFRIKVERGCTFEETSFKIEEIKETRIYSPRFSEFRDDRFYSTGIINAPRSGFYVHDFPSMEKISLFEYNDLEGIHSFIELSENEILASKLGEVLIVLNLKTSEVEILETIDTNTGSWFNLLRIDEKEMFAIAMEDIYLYGWKERKHLCTLNGGGDYVKELSYLAESDELVTLTGRRVVRVYDIENRTLKKICNAAKLEGEVLGGESLMTTKDLVLIGNCNELISVDDVISSTGKPENNLSILLSERIMLITEISFEEDREVDNAVQIMKERMMFLMNSCENAIVEIKFTNGTMCYPVSLYKIQDKTVPRKGNKVEFLNEHLAHLEEFDLVKFWVGGRFRNCLKFFELFWVFKLLNFAEMMYFVCVKVGKVLIKDDELVSLLTLSLTKLEGYPEERDKMIGILNNECENIQVKSSFTLCLLKQIKKREKEFTNFIRNNKEDSNVLDMLEPFLKMALIELRDHGDYQDCEFVVRNKGGSLINYKNFLLKNMVESKNFSNLTLKTVNGSEKFPVHKDILVLRSNFFYEMFKFPGQESSQTLVEISFLSDESLKVLLEFIYLGEYHSECTLYVLLQVLRHCLMYFERSIELRITKKIKSKLEELFRDDCNSGMLKLLELGNLINDLPQKKQNEILRPLKKMNKDDIIYNTIQYSVKMNNMVQDLQIENGKLSSEKEVLLTEMRKRKRKRNSEVEKLENRKRIKR